MLYLRTDYCFHLMPITPYHAELFAHELTKRFASDSGEKLATVLSDAQRHDAALCGRVREMRFGRPIECIVEHRLEQAARFGVGSG